MAGIVLELSQQKIYVNPTRYLIQHWIKSATPEKLKYAFLVSPSAGISSDAERLVSIATMDDYVNGGYEVNPLDVFGDIDNHAALLAAQPGDELTFVDAPPEWAGITTTQVLSASNGFVDLVEPLPWCVTGSLTWILSRGGVELERGFNGYCKRRLPLQKFLTDRFTSAFDTGAEALTHLISVKTQLNALAKSAAMDENEFLTFAPSNPVLSTLPE